MTLNPFRKPRFWIVFVITGGLLVYLFLTDAAVVRKIIGYNVPQITKPPAGVDYLKAPDGFMVSVFADGLNDPRVIAFDPKGRILVSEPKEGKVIILEDQDGNGVAESKKTLLENLRLPHGLAFYTDTKTKKNYLYVAETHQVSRFEYDSAKGLVVDIIGKNIANLPADGRHFTRTIDFGPNYRTQAIIPGYRETETLADKKLYISVGSSCDVCVENTTWKRAAILESDPEGNFTAEFAGGLRNSVFFTFHPITGEIWATDMGRDNLGDELPPDEVNIVKVAGPEQKFGARRYGWPFCYGDRVADKTFKPGKVDRIDIPTDCSQTESAAIELPAHSAPLGLAFIPKDGGWPKEWRNDLLVAYHGSWNRSEPTGYKVVKFKVNEKGQVSGTEDFISGWLVPNVAEGLTPPKTLGRPVDLKFGPDGALYVSDDSAGVIYRVSPVK